MRRIVLVGVVCVCCVGVFALRALSDDEEQRKSLVGISGVQVVIEGLTPEAEKDGLTAKSLQTKTELGLREHGIRVFNEEEHAKAVGAGRLQVRLLLRKRAGLVYSCVARCELTQKVKLSKNPEVEIQAVTWDATPWAGEMLFNNLKERIPVAVQEQIDEFMNAFLAANPKKD